MVQGTITGLLGGVSIQIGAWEFVHSLGGLSQGLALHSAAEVAGPKREKGGRLVCSAARAGDEAL